MLGIDVVEILVPLGVIDLAQDIRSSVRENRIHAHRLATQVQLRLDFFEYRGRAQHIVLLEYHVLIWRNISSVALGDVEDIV